ncbi:MAG: DNA primase TraC [Ignavibacteriaceae bacterium]|nr:DNA primase TraC [Ignavibacteriaceae bacterium]
MLPPFINNLWRSKMFKSEIFNKTTDAILQKLKEGIIPWRKSWKSGIPRNYISKRPYNGINFLSLCTMDFSSPYFLTFLQCKQKNGYIKRGEQGTLVVFWKLEDTLDAGGKDDISNQVKQVPLLRYSYVFNINQTSISVGSDDAAKIIPAEKIIESIEDKPVIKHNFRRCYYSVQQDIISIPVIDEFDKPEEYYSSLFHELIHWTGHPSRLRRDLSAMDDAYAFEELIAEIGSSFLGALAGISPSILDNQAAYINGWLNLISDNKQILVRASIEARKAVDYLLSESVIPESILQCRSGLPESLPIV